MFDTNSSPTPSLSSDCQRYLFYCYCLSPCDGQTLCELRKQPADVDRMIYSPEETVKLVNERGVCSILRGQTQMKVEQHTLSVRLSDVILYCDDDDERRKKEKLESNLLSMRPVTLDHGEHLFREAAESIKQCQLRIYRRLTFFFFPGLYRCLVEGQTDGNHGTNQENHYEHVVKCFPA